MRCLTPRFRTIAEAVSKLSCRMESLGLNSKDLRELPLTDPSTASWYGRRKVDASHTAAFSPKADLPTGTRDGCFLGAARLRLQHLVKVRLGCEPNRLKELSLVLSPWLVASLRASEARNDCCHPLIIRGRLQSFEATIGCPMHAPRFWREFLHQAVGAAEPPPAIRIRSRTERPLPKRVSTGAVSDCSQEIPASIATRMKSASDSPIMRARLRREEAACRPGWR